MLLSRAPWLLPVGTPETMDLAIIRRVVHAMVAAQAAAKLQLERKLRLQQQLQRQQLQQGWRNRRFRATPLLFHTSLRKGLLPVRHDSSALKTLEGGQPRLGLRVECDVGSTSAT